MCVLAGVCAGMVIFSLRLAALISYWHSVAFLVPTLALLGLLLANTRLRKLFLFGCLSLVVLWCGVCFSPLTMKLSQGILRSDVVEPADAIFVFSSGLQSDGDLTAMAMARLLHGLELLGQGKAPRIIFSEVESPRGVYSDIARKFISEFGIKGEVFDVGRVNNTRDEARLVSALCRSKGWKRVLAVTSPTHSLRASAALENEGLQVIASPSTEVEFDLESLDMPEDRMRALGSILHERLGIFVYRMRGWLH